MSTATLEVAVVYLALVALVALLAAAGLRLGPAVGAGVIVGELLLVVQAALVVVAYLRGERPAEPATNVGYLVVSVVLLPLLARRALTSETGPSRSDYVVVALACGAAVVVSLRLHATWG